MTKTFLIFLLLVAPIFAEIQCPKCSFKNTDEDVLCLNCAEPIREETAAEKLKRERTTQEAEKKKLEEEKAQLLIQQQPQSQKNEGRISSGDIRMEWSLSGAFAHKPGNQTEICVKCINYSKRHSVKSLTVRGKFHGGSGWATEEIFEMVKSYDSSIPPGGGIEKKFTIQQSGAGSSVYGLKGDLEVLSVS